MELALEGHPIQVLSVNMPSGKDSQSAMTAKCSYPLLQDLEEIDVWGLMQGGKDDFYIYDQDNRLVQHFPWGSEPALNLSTPEGYEALKGAILQALNVSEPVVEDADTLDGDGGSAPAADGEAPEDDASGEVDDVEPGPSPTDSDDATEGEDPAP